MLLEHATQYYKNLFSPANSNVIPREQSFWDDVTMLSTTDNEILCRPFSPFSIFEIKVALFQMEHNKAVGPDNIPIELFQNCWEIVKQDIVRCLMTLTKES